ncbi:MAG: hypothetical protein ACK2UW_18735 [Anaerolineales bacterium]|jgi:hypothetical protein
MDIFFQDPNEIPLPPEEVRILNFTAKPYPDGRRIRVHLELTPFQKRPNLTLYAENPENRRVAEASVIESMTRTLEITMHLRGPQQGGSYVAHVQVYYLPEQEAQDPADQPSPDQEASTIVDQAEAQFFIEDFSPK